MKKNVQPNNFKFEIVELIGALKENDQHNWSKSVARIAWNDNPITLDIRHMNIPDNKVNKGISLTDEEVDKLITLLLDNDYGSLELLERAISKKRQRFTIDNNSDMNFINDDKYIIDIKMKKK